MLPPMNDAIRKLIEDAPYKRAVRCLDNVLMLLSQLRLFSEETGRKISFEDLRKCTRKYYVRPRNY